ncbi:MAG: hypothetical protein U0169_25825 [Polyangiaceae bacterium]
MARGGLQREATVQDRDDRHEDRHGGALRESEREEVGPRERDDDGPDEFEPQRHGKRREEVERRERRNEVRRTSHVGPTREAAAEVRVPEGKLVVLLQAHRGDGPVRRFRVPIVHPEELGVAETRREDRTRAHDEQRQCGDVEEARADERADVPGAIPSDGRLGG